MLLYSTFLKAEVSVINKPPVLAGGFSCLFWSLLGFATAVFVIDSNGGLRRWRLDQPAPKGG